MQITLMDYCEKLKRRDEVRVELGYNVMVGTECFVSL